MLDPLAQAQAQDQQALASEQSQAASTAMQDLLLKLASKPNPEAWAAQGGPLPPMSAPPVPSQDAPSGDTSSY